MTNYCASTTDSIVKMTHSITKMTNSFAKVTNSFAQTCKVFYNLILFGLVLIQTLSNDIVQCSSAENQPSSCTITLKLSKHESFQLDNLKKKSCNMS